MKKPLTYICHDEVLAKHLAEHFDIVVDPEVMGDCVFIDWWPPNAEVGMEQVYTLENATKRQCKIAVFDRYCSLKLHEVHWLLKYKNVTLFEPCLITRPGFIYLPFWYECNNLSYIDKEQSSIGVVKDPYRKNIIYDYDIPSCNSYEDLTHTMIFGSREEYGRGYLPDMHEIFNCLCVPLLPVQHKYYCSLFNGLVIREKKDIDYYLGHTINDAIIYGIYDNIHKLFPEMLVANVARKINNLLTK